MLDSRQRNKSNTEKPLELPVVGSVGFGRRREGGGIVDGSEEDGCIGARNQNNNEEEERSKGQLSDVCFSNRR